jgi:hypothetical protein
MRSCAASSRSPRGRIRTLLVALALAGTAGRAAALELGELLHGMASAPGVQARFHETKEIALLSAPIESEGEIVFVPPRRFARITTQPAATRFVVDGDRLLFRDQAGEQRLSVAGSRTARAVVENFIVLWTGDAEGLAARYTMAFSSEGSHWRLGLEPRDAAVAAVIARVLLVGDGPQLLEMTLEEPNGDRSVTRFREVRIGSLSDAALARAFGAETPP